MTLNKDNIYNNMPQIIKSLLLISEGWLVGSSVQSLSDGTHVKDFDIIVEDPELFQRANQLLYSSTFGMSLNSFGGLKYIGHGMSIDLWISNPSHFFTNRKKNAYLIYSLKHLMVLSAY